MKFEYTIPVSVDIDHVWEKAQNHVGLMKCLPGVEEVEDGEQENEYKIILSTKFGPVRLRFNGNATVTHNEENKSMKADVRMSDSRTGSVHGSYEMVLANSEVEGETNLLVSADVNIAGKLGEFAQPLIKRKADQIIKEFSDNLKSYMTE